MAAAADVLPATSLADLPDDALEAVLWRLEARDRHALLACSRRLRALSCATPTLWRELEARASTVPQAASLAAWLRPRRQLILHLSLDVSAMSSLEWSTRSLPWASTDPVLQAPGQQAEAVVRALAGGPLRTLRLLLHPTLNALTLGAWLPESLPRLESLHVRAERIFVQAGFGAATSLRGANLSDVSCYAVPGCLPRSLRHLTATFKLLNEAPNQGYPDELPEALLAAPYLESLELTVPASCRRGFGVFTQLTRLCYTPRGWMGPIPADLGSLPRLLELDLTPNCVIEHEEALVPLSRLTTLSKLRFGGGASFHCPLPPWLLALPRLKELEVSAREAPPYLEPLRAAALDIVALERLTLCTATAVGSGPGLSTLTTLASLRLQSQGYGRVEPPDAAGVAALLGALGALPALRELVMELQPLARAGGVPGGAWGLVAGAFGDEEDDDDEEDGEEGDGWDDPIPGPEGQAGGEGAPGGGGGGGAAGPGGGGGLGAGGGGGAVAAGPGPGGAGPAAGGQPAPPPQTPLGERGRLPDFAAVAAAFPRDFPSGFPALRLFKLVLQNEDWQRRLAAGGDAVERLGLLSLAARLMLPRLERVEVWAGEEYCMDVRVLPPR